MRNRWLILLVALVVATLSTGCDDDDDHELVGSWQDATGEILTFSSDNSFRASDWSVSSTGTWAVSGDVLTLTMSESGQTASQTYNYSVTGNALSIMAGGNVVAVYTKM